MTSVRHAYRDIAAALARLETLQHAQTVALQRLACRLDDLSRRVEATVQSGATSDGEQRESSAVALAKAGASVAELTRQCGLPEVDAELLRTLYGRGAASVIQVS